MIYNNLTDCGYAGQDFNVEDDSYNAERFMRRLTFSAEQRTNVRVAILETLVRQLCGDITSD